MKVGFLVGRFSKFSDNLAKQFEFSSNTYQERASSRMRDTVWNRLDEANFDNNFVGKSMRNNPCGTGVAVTFNSGNQMHIL